MLRIIGTVCILGGSMGLGWSMVGKMKERLSALYIIRQIFRMFQSEITYSKAAYPEACRRIAGKVNEPYKTAFMEIYEQMTANRGGSFQTIWKQSMERCLKALPLSEEERQACLDFGDCAGYMDGQMQAEAIGHYMHSLELAVKKLEDEMTNKSKVIMSLSAMGGLLTAIVLI